jgi:SpoVK/Ycf46/Vps4 family AAA+-type ATPase
MHVKMLRFMEGMTGAAKVSIIFASNRPGRVNLRTLDEYAPSFYTRAEDLDSALLSRCAGVVRFELPTAEQRRQIWRFYAKQYTDDSASSAASATTDQVTWSPLDRLVMQTEGMTARDIKR